MIDEWVSVRIFDKTSRRTRFWFFTNLLLLTPLDKEE